MDQSFHDSTINGREGTPLLMIAAKGGFFNFMGTLGGKSLAFFFQVLVSRLYGPPYFGLFVTGLLVCQIMQLASALGLQKGGMRFLAIAHERHDYHMMPVIFRTVIFFPLLLGTVMACVSYALSPFLAEICFKDIEMVRVLKHFSFAVPFLALLQVASESSRAFKTTKYAIMIENLLFPLFQIAFFIALHTLGYGFSSVVYSFVLAAFVCSLWIMIILRSQVEKCIQPMQMHGSLERSSLFSRNWWPILFYSIPLMPSSLLLIAGNSMDIVMLNILTDSRGVGEYAAAARWIMLFSMIHVSLNLIFGPLMAGQLGLNKMDQVKNLYRTETRWMVFLTLPIFVFLLIAREPMMLVFGKGFLQSGPTVLGILILGSLFTALSGSAGLLLTMSNHQYTELSCLGGYALLNISLNLLWIPQYGIVGAAFATTLSNIATVSIRILMTYLHLNMHPFSKHFVIPVVTTSILCLAGLLLQPIFQMDVLMQMALSLCTAFLVLLSIMVGGLETSDNELFSMLREKLTKERSCYPSSHLT